MIKHLQPGDTLAGFTDNWILDGLECSSNHPKPFSGTVADTDHEPAGHPEFAGKDIVIMTDGRVYERPDYYHHTALYGWVLTREANEPLPA